MIHGLIYICPECRNVLVYRAHEDGTVNLNTVVCVEDEYTMKVVKLDTALVDKLLKGSVENAA